MSKTTLSPSSTTLTQNCIGFIFTCTFVRSNYSIICPFRQNIASYINNITYWYFHHYFSSKQTIVLRHNWKYKSTVTWSSTSRNCTIQLMITIRRIIRIFWHPVQGNPSSTSIIVSNYS